MAKTSKKGDDHKVNPNRAARHAAQVALYLKNIELRREGLPTPWMIAKANRAERRKGMKPQERTGLGNIIVLMPDGHKRVIPGSKRETEAMLEARARERAEQEAPKRKKTAKRAPKKVATA